MKVLLFVIAVTAGCKASESITCGEGTELKGTICVASPAAAPSPPDRNDPAKPTPDAPPSCEQLCKQLVACPAPKERAPLAEMNCIDRCSMAEVIDPADRPRCSDGCGGPECTAAYDWASQPRLVSSEPTDPVVIETTGFDREQQSVTVKARNNRPSPVSVTLFAWCANDYMAIVGTVRDSFGMQPGKGSHALAVGTPSESGPVCAHAWVTIDSVRLEDGALWRPWPAAASEPKPAE